MNELEQLKAFFAEKSILIDNLHEHHHSQNDLEFSIALLKMDFKHNIESEIEFLIFENSLNELYNELKEHDTSIVEALTKIEHLSFLIMNL
jgi:hypothetical protein